MKECLTESPKVLAVDHQLGNVRVAENSFPDGHLAQTDGVWIVAAMRRVHTARIDIARRASRRKAAGGLQADMAKWPAGQNRIERWTGIRFAEIEIGCSACLTIIGDDQYPIDRGDNAGIDNGSRAIERHQIMGIRPTTAVAGVLVGVEVGI